MRSHDSVNETSTGLSTIQVSLTVIGTTDFGANWLPSGIDSGPEYTLDPTTPDDVDIAKDSDGVYVVVRPSPGRYRIAGWRNPSIARMDFISTDSIIRGKFYIYASNPAFTALNQIPNFRIRLDNEGAVLASSSYAYAQTGIGGGEVDSREPFYSTLNNPAAEQTAGLSLYPSLEKTLPSLYRLDFLPVETPSITGTNIGATFESYATNYASQNEGAGILALTELSTAIYPANDPARRYKTLYTYQNDARAQTFMPPNPPWESVTTGQFNVENDFQAGRLQTLDLPDEVPDSVLTQVITTTDQTGVIMDTVNTPTDRFGVGIWTLGSNSDADTPRIEANKVYQATFVVASDIPTTSSSSSDVLQGGIHFQIQTGLGVVTNRLELTGPVTASAPDSAAKRITAESLPGIGGQDLLQIPGGPSLSSLLLPGESGGVYNVLMSSPLDGDTRADNGGTIGVLAAQPGPGVSGASSRDITIGINVISQPQTLRLTPTLLAPWAQPNRSRIRIIAAFLRSFDQIDDGGYAFLP
jgi:hypothetical protein